MQVGPDDPAPVPVLPPIRKLTPAAEDTMRLPRRFLLACGSLALLLSRDPGGWAQEASRTLLVTPELHAKDPGTLTRSGARRTKVVEAIDRVKAAVVNIHSERTVTGSTAE